MPRCADSTCGRWRPDLTSFGRLGAGSAQKFGALRFNGRWYCSRACVEQAALAGLEQRRPAPAVSTGLPPLRLGVLLRHAGAVTQAQLEEALEAAGRSGLRIGTQLERLGFTTADEVLRALAAQGGVSYLSTFDIARLRRVPALLPPAMVRALGLIPFEADDVMRRLSVICTAPVPRTAMRALVRLTGWTPEVYLVTDAVFQSALDACEAESGETTPHALTVASVAQAAAHVANAAAIERTVTMRHADCEAYRWVRVQGAQQVSDLLVTQEGSGCQAELTAH